MDRDRGRAAGTKHPPLPAPLAQCSGFWKDEAGAGAGRGGRCGRDERTQGTSGWLLSLGEFSLKPVIFRLKPEQDVLLRSSIPAPPSWPYPFRVVASTPPPAPLVLWGAQPLMGSVTCKWFSTSVDLRAT